LEGRAEEADAGLLGGRDGGVHVGRRAGRRRQDELGRPPAEGADEILEAAGGHDGQQPGGLLGDDAPGVGHPSGAEAEAAGAEARYSLTDAGERALRQWIGEPSTWPRIQHEAIVRVLAADIADDEALADSLAGMRVEIDELDELNRESAERAHDLPHRERYLGMVRDLGQRLIVAHREWLDEIEERLRRGD
jgi:hypothetical protein